MTRGSDEKNDGRMVGVIAVLAGLRRWRVGDAVRAGGEVVEGFAEFEGLWMVQSQSRRARMAASQRRLSVEQRRMTPDAVSSRAARAGGWRGRPR